jgi:hypothetical protein
MIARKLWADEYAEKFLSFWSVLCLFLKFHFSASGKGEKVSGLRSSSYPLAYAHLQTYNYATLFFLVDSNIQFKLSVITKHILYSIKKKSVFKFLILKSCKSSSVSVFPLTEPP